ncbi:MAG: anti-sigma F factor [Clostridia bacterium]|nr:anti-sigma F factor [Clostridia bacterium]
MQYADDVTITFASLSKNELLARSFAAAYAAQFDPTVRELEDIKTAISEAVTNVVVHAYPDRIGQVELHFSSQGDVLTMEVTDRGVGISDIQAAREPMFTTKPEQERSGLGFTVMEAFMDELCISSVSNEGTTVTMRKRIDQKRSMDMA